MKIGLILECQESTVAWQKNADELVCCHIIEQLEPGTEIEPIFLNNKPNLLAKCGKNAAQLLENGCCCVIIVWDLYPPWEGEANAENDYAAVKKSLKEAGVDKDAPVYCVCISYELETWFIVDRQVMVDAFPKVKSAKFKKVKDFERTDPKTILSDYFPGRYTGRTSHVVQLIKGLTSEKFDRIRKKCTSFGEFVDSVGKCKTVSE